jgi:hypothetical protein
MDLRRIFDKCLTDIGGEKNRDVRWYLYERPERISRRGFFQEAVWTVWTSGFKWERAKSILKKAEEKGFSWDYNDVSSWNRQYLNGFIEALHGKPIPNRAQKKWEAIYEIAKRVKGFESEEDFRNSFFNGKVLSKELDGIDVNSLLTLELPFIGVASAQHIIRNMGGEVIKCDRWIDAFLEHHKISLNQLESLLRERNIPLGFFDLVIWEYCERFIKKVNKFTGHFKNNFNNC